MTFPVTDQPEDAGLRSRLGSFYEMLRLEAEEGALAARGIERRQSARNLIIEAAFRSAEYYAALRALIADQVQLPDNPGALALNVMLMPAEVRELAVCHDTAAGIAERSGDHDEAQRRRDRSVQLHSLIPAGAK